MAYGQQPVVDDVSLEMERGCIACLLGPSGCGKTTLLRGIAGFEPVLRGSISIGERLVSSAGFRLPPEERRVGMVFQDYALFPHLRVIENVAFGLHTLGSLERQRRAGFWLEVVGLSGLERAWPHELSGGQQQRVALARALAPEPELLLMDEPFSNLDTELRDNLAREVGDLLRQRGATALLVTHDQREAFAIADRIGILHEGRLRQWDAAYNLYHWPADRFVADFIGEGVMLPAQVREDGALALSFGELRGEFTDQQPALRPGEPVEVLLRPDDIIHDDASPLTAEVLHKAFRGAEILYTIRLDGGAEVLTLVPSHHDHAIGERIGIRIMADHVVAFPAR